MSLPSLIFADIEASGLQFLSYPIEIGWAWDNGRTVKTRSILIRPTAEWLSWKTGWSEEAEQLHGISLQQLQDEGVEPAEACRRLNDELRGKEVAFDTGPAAHDARWLSILYRAAASEPTFSLAQLSSDLCILAFGRMCRIPDSVILQLERLAPKTVHRAALDAAQWAWWRVVLRTVSETEVGGVTDIEGIAASVRIEANNNA